jgi:hypothetical protein
MGTKKTHFEEYLTFRTLAHKFDDSGRITDMVLNDPENEGKPEIKNLCAKLHVSLVDRLDVVCTFLDISKREFVERSLIESLEVAENIISASLGSAETENVKN